MKEMQMQNLDFLTSNVQKTICDVLENLNELR